jgi:hypothetical protein
LGLAQRRKGARERKLLAISYSEFIAIPAKTAGTKADSRNADQAKILFWHFNYFDADTDAEF